MIPMSRLQDDVVPELSSKHLLKQGNHGPQSICHSVIRLFEGNDEDLDIFNFISESSHQVLYRLLFLQKLITKARSINDGESLSSSCVSHPVSLICTRSLGDAVKTCADFETSIVESSAIVIFVSSNQNIGKT